VRVEALSYVAVRAKDLDGRIERSSPEAAQRRAAGAGLPLSRAVL
jgi:hypothetical protein